MKSASAIPMVVCEAAMVFWPQSEAAIMRGEGR